MSVPHHPAPKDNTSLMRRRSSSPPASPAQPWSLILGIRTLFERCFYGTTPKYRRNWEPVSPPRYRAPLSQKEWTDFYTFWWGPNSSGKDILDAVHNTQELSRRIIQISQPVVYCDLAVLAHSWGSLMVIREYESLYDRLVLAHRCPWTRRIVLSGQPGIGKSYFLIYALLRRMVEGQPVLFSTSFGDVYLFDQFGIATMRKDSVTLDDLPPFDCTVCHSCAWSLVDADVKREPEVSKVTHEGFLFTVLAVPLLRKVYKHWNRRALMFIMEPWTAEELHPLLKHLNLMEPELEVPVTLEDVQKVMVEAGPCPHDLLRYVLDKNGWEWQLRVALRTLTSPQMIVDVARQARITMDLDPRSLFLVRPNKSGLPLQSDLPAISFKSPFIALKIQERFRYLSVESTKQLFEASSSFANGSIFAGWAFEALATGYLSRYQTDADTIFRPFASMTRIEGMKNHFQHFQYEGTPLTAFIEVDSIAGDVKYVTDNLMLDGFEPQRTQRSLPLLRRAIVPYHDIASLQPGSLQYYVPFSRINPFFDSFFLERSRLGVVVWVFRMAIAREHSGSIKGMDQLQRLIDIIKLKTRNVEVIYVLVAPHKPGEGVKWKMPQMWERVEGEVCVQYVDFSAFPRCKYEDLFNHLPY